MIYLLLTRQSINRSIFETSFLRGRMWWDFRRWFENEKKFFCLDVILSDESRNGQLFNLYFLGQGLATNGPRPFIAIEPATFFNDRYAAINRRNDSHLTFWSSPPIRPKKRPESMAKTFSFGLRHQLDRKKAWISGEDLSPLVRWNLVRTECGPLVQKVADPSPRYRIRYKN